MIPCLIRNYLKPRTTPRKEIENIDAKFIIVSKKKKKNENLFVAGSSLRESYIIFLKKLCKNKAGKNRGTKVNDNIMCFSLITLLTLVNLILTPNDAVNFKIRCRVKSRLQF